MILGRDELKARKLAIEQVPVPELGDDAAICVAEMMAGPAIEFADLAQRYAEAEKEGHPDQAGFINELLSRTITDDQGAPLFTDAAEVGAVVLPFPVRQRLFERAAQLNGLTAEAQASAEGNSDGPSSGALRIA